MTHTAHYYLGVDGGQSSTTSLLADQTGRVLGQGRSGPCNHITGKEAVARFVTELRDCVAQASHEAGLDASATTFRSTCLGLSGGPEDKEEHVRAAIRSEIFKITNDAEIALSGATAGEPGIIVIAGTGSIALGRNAAGKMARAGGWGYVFGDEAGGFDLVRRALRAALQYEEGWGPATILHSRLLKSAGAPTANAALHLFYTPDFPKAKIASFASLVDDAANDGDAVAKDILDAAGRELSRYVNGVYGNLFHAGEHVPVAYVGGVFQSAAIREALSSGLSGTGGCRLVAPRFTPVAGALLEAFRIDQNYSRLSGVPQSVK